MKKIEILGPGCPKCNALSENVKKALRETNQTAEVVKVTDIKEMVAKGVMMTPGLVIDGKIISQGKTLSIEQIKELMAGGVKNEQAWNVAGNAKRKYSLVSRD